MRKDEVLRLIDEYLLDRNNISKEWIECLEICKRTILENDRLKRKNIDIASELAKTRLKYQHAVNDATYYIKAYQKLATS